MKKPYVCLLILLTPSLLIADQSSSTGAAEINQATQLLQQPASTAQVISALSAQQPVTVSQRHGGWYQVNTAAPEQGWVRLFTVRFIKLLHQPGTGTLPALNAVLKAGHSNVASTSGVRGLDKNTINQAQPDFTALSQLKSYRIEKAAAQTFAAEGQLQATAVATKRAPQ